MEDCACRPSGSWKLLFSMGGTVTPQDAIESANRRSSAPVTLAKCIEVAA